MQSGQRVYGEINQRIETARLQAGAQARDLQALTVELDRSRAGESAQTRELARLRLDLLAAHDHPAFGPAGLMASLLIGLLLNVVLRSGEFLLAMPAVNAHAPGWAARLFALMATDVAVMSFFYTVCFVLALRKVPLFPRMLLFTWLLDATAQLIIARQIGLYADLPPAIAQNLGELLRGNVTKVMISMLVWLPYLILSERVNVTYRHRTGE